jgi:transposase-like protein
MNFFINVHVIFYFYQSRQKMFVSRQEKERLVLDLYSQGKTYQQIAKEVRTSPNQIRDILKKEEEKEKNNTITENHEQQVSLSTKAYELIEIQGHIGLTTKVGLFTTK